MAMVASLKSKRGTSLTLHKGHGRQEHGWTAVALLASPEPGARGAGGAGGQHKGGQLQRVHDEVCVWAVVCTGAPQFCKICKL